MDSKLQQQFFDLITKSQRVLLALPKNPNGDTLGSGLALANFLAKLNKEVDVICETSDFGKYSFLSGIEKITNSVNLPKNFVVSVSTEKAKLDELSYDVLEDKVNIYLKPKQGAFESSDVSFGSEVPGYNLIICVDTPSLETLGSLYEKNAEVFFDTPKVNIDNHLNNENYATLNIVDITASSTAEILLDLLKNYEKSLIDENIATNLLTGIIYETNSFQHSSTNPNSFMNASELVNFGARQNEIITHLFKTKQLAVLKLWGRALARLKTLPEFSAVFSAVNSADVEKSGINEEDLTKVAEDFADNLGDHKIGFLVVELSDHLEVYIVSNPNIRVAAALEYFNAEMVTDKIGKFNLNNLSLIEAEAKIVQGLSDLKQRIGI